MARLSQVALGFMVLLLAACTGGGDKPAKPDGNKAIVLGFSQIGAESEWRTANTRSIQEAAPAAGITLRFSDAQQKQENQIKALRSFIAQRVDVIAFSPVVETGWETVLREAKTAKIPVILTDRAVDVIAIRRVVHADQEPASAFGLWILIDECGEFCVVMELDEMRQLVHDDVVEHPRRKLSEPRRQADLTVRRRARSPLRLLVVDESDRLRRR